MKTLINFTLCILCALNLCAQSSGSYLGNYAQAAPNVASLGKYVDYPVGYYTGVPQVDVPIYELSDGAAKISVSLNYHASGIRVSELASWVGLGWSLQAGGMISRSVRGGTDEGVWNAQATPAGYYLDSGIRKMPLLPYPTNGVISKTAADDARQNFYAQVNAGNADTEPDLFTFSFGSYSGKFVFDENRTPTLLENQDLKIAVSDGNFSSWTIITPDGVKYLFGESNMREVNNTYNNEVLDGHTQKPSSWMLTRIIYPNTKDTVYFNYTPEVYAYFDLGGETDLYDQTSGANAPQQACYNNPVRQFVSVVRTKVSGLRLTSIKSKNYTISFIAKTQRQDLISYSGNPYPYQLDSIKIFNSQNQCLKQYLLSYTYFASTTATGAPTVALSTLNGDITDTKRLKLTSVKEFSGDGLSSKPAWTFAYDETYQLPRRISYDQDHWGYSNNYSGNVNDRFMPRVNHPICTNVAGPAANRNSSWPSMKSYSLISLANPLGVVTKFEFEANNVSGTMVGGLRIHKISTIENVGGDTLVRQYDYQNSGVLYRMPEYLTQPVNEYYYTSYPQNTSYIGYDYSNYQVIRCLLKQSQSIVPLQDFQGNHIGYGSVKEIFGANGEGGSKEYNYNAYDNNSTSRLDIDNYTDLTTIYNGSTAISGNYGNSHFNDITPQNLSYYFSTMLYPYAPQQVDFRRGKLVSELTYDSAGNLLKSVYNTYNENYDESKWIRGFKIFRSAIPNVNSGSSSGDYNDALTFYKLHTGISHPVQTITTDYKDGKSMTTTSNYGYESAYHTLKTSDTTTNSQGDVIINKSYYSFDYANTATSDNVFAKMKNRNMLVPIGLRIWKNNTLVSGKIIQYKDFASSGTDTFVNPVKIYAVEATDPLTTAQAGESIALTGQLTTLIPNSYFKEKASFNYDGTTGRMEEQKLVNDKNQVLIWDNQTLMPLAIADNAYSSNDVAYTGFETAETGNWSYSSGNVITDATAPTGAKAYSLTSAISKAALTSSKKYTISYWYKTGAAVTITGGTQSNAITGLTLNGWTYKQVNITGTTSVSLSGSGSVDEVRLYPSDGQMISYTYDGLLRLTAQCSANSTISRYEYDSFNRLIDIKDQYGNILKAFEYNYGASNR